MDGLSHMLYCHGVMGGAVEFGYIDPWIYRCNANNCVVFVVVFLRKSWLCRMWLPMERKSVNFSVGVKEGIVYFSNIFYFSNNTNHVWSLSFLCFSWTLVLFHDFTCDNERIDSYQWFCFSMSRLCDMNHMIIVISRFLQ